MTGETPCPLCEDFCSDGSLHQTIRGARPYLFYEDSVRQYLRCPTCALVYVPRRYHLSLAREKSEYDQHRNDPADAGYRAFLSRLADPLLARLPDSAQGLDFGCGPGPALAAILREAGHEVVLYDPFYAPSPLALSQEYQFILATEVVEHLRKPGPELARLWAQIEPGGWLAVMTKLVSSQEAFSRWHYIRDPTHICFFSRATWAWWAQAHSAELEFVGADVILLRKGR